MSAPISISYSLANLILGGGTPGALPAADNKSVAQIFENGALQIYGYPASETTPRPAPADANAEIPDDGTNGFLLAVIDDTGGYLGFLPSANGILSKNGTQWDGAVDPDNLNPSYPTGTAGDLTDTPFIATFFRLVHTDSASRAADTPTSTDKPRIQGLITPQDSGAGVLASVELAAPSTQIIDQFRIALPMFAP